MVRADTCYSFMLSKRYVLMLKRDYERDSGEYINFYMQKRNDAHWIHLFATPIRQNWTSVIGDDTLDWFNKRHIEKIVEHYEDRIKNTEIPLYDELLREFEITEERMSQTGYE